MGGRGGCGEGREGGGGAAGRDGREVGLDELVADLAEDVIVEEVLVVGGRLGEAVVAHLAVEEQAARVGHHLGRLVRLLDVGDHGLGSDERRSAHHALQLHVERLDVLVEAALLREGPRAELALERDVDLDALTLEARGVRGERGLVGGLRLGRAAVLVGVAAVVGCGQRARLVLLGYVFL